MKQNRLKPLKVMFYRAAPGLYQSLQDRFWHKRYDPIYAAVRKTHGHTVAEGPFQGMEYIESSFGSSYLPKLLGCYESELFGVIEEIASRPYEVIVDVGCAEGYYAVGLAKRLPGAEVYAFDIEPEAREKCSELAGKNHLEAQVHVRGLCDAEALNALDLRQGLIVCDCEGFELELLQPERSPGLKQADVLVELHEFTKAGLTETLLGRFRETHDIRLIDTQPRRTDEIRSTHCLTPEQRGYAVDEGRPGSMQWACMTHRE